jgi:hypothetical protein
MFVGVELTRTLTGEREVCRQCGNQEYLYVQYVVVLKCCNRSFHQSIRPIIMNITYCFCQQVSQKTETFLLEDACKEEHDI